MNQNTRKDIQTLTHTPRSFQNILRRRIRTLLFAYDLPNSDDHCKVIEDVFVLYSLGHDPTTMHTETNHDPYPKHPTK